jgi:hypothetical protein
LSGPEQTFIDLAATGINLVDLVVLGDAMLKAKLTTIPTLIEAWHGCGTRLALRAARLIRDGVDSPMETRVRLLIVMAGLPEPTVNVIIRGEDGSWRMRFDLCYLDQRLIVVYDGRRHADSPEQWERDIFRREDLDRMDYRLLIVTSRGVYNAPHRTLERIRDARLPRLLAHRAVNPPPSSSLAEEKRLLAPPPYGGARFRRSQPGERGVHVPSRFKNEWRRHFPTTA